jgi:hypothetical protein
VKAGAVPHWAASVSGALSLLGLVCLILTLALGFESPNTALLILSALTFAAPLSVLWHLVVTRKLTAAEKRVWARELTGADALRALSEYMNSSDLRASAVDLVLRREAKNQA